MLKPPAYSNIKPGAPAHFPAQQKPETTHKARLSLPFPRSQPSRQYPGPAGTRCPPGPYRGHSEGCALWQRACLGHSPCPLASSTRSVVCDCGHLGQVISARSSGREHTLLPRSWAPPSERYLLAQWSPSPMTLF